MRETPLHDWHASHGAKMVEFAGWEMPLYYSAILEEHHAVRNAAGLFDVSHMGRLRLTGPRALDLTQLAITNDAGRLQPGRACYGLVCTPSGGVIDDVIVYREQDGCLIIPNASNREAVSQWLEELRAERRWEARIEDLGETLGMIALQGPASVAILNAVAAEPMDDLRHFSARPAMAAGIGCQVARTGYTGEDGFEILAPSGRLVELWEALMAAGAADGLRPAGLGARDSLRIEACYPLYGHELTLETNPMFAGLARFVKLNKPDFIGKEALANARIEEATRCLAAFEMTERSVPRQGCAVLCGGRPIGEVTSGLFSPSLKKGLGLAYIESAHTTPGTEIQVQIHSKQFAARVAERPLYRRGAD